MSANMASSDTLLNMIFESSLLIGGPSCEVVDESDAVDTVREDELDDVGGDNGAL